MNRSFPLLLIAGLCLPSLAETDAPPRLGEVMEILEREAPGIGREEIEEAALQGLLGSFGARLRLVSPAEPPPPAEPLARCYQPSIGYISVPLIDASSSRLIGEAYRRLDDRHALRGLVLDLRRASGEDYGEVLRIAGLFVSEEIPLMDWGEGMRPAVPGERPIGVPLAALVDGGTREAGEALAAIVRSARIGILVGEDTAGEAVSWKRFPLETGHVLEVAGGSIRLAEGTELQAGRGVAPDIRAVAGTGEGSSGEARAPQEEAGEPLPPPQDDPLLARALELLKGIGIVEDRNRS